MPNVRITADESNQIVFAQSAKTMPCGQRGHLDTGAGYPEYRCEFCGALENSSGMPKSCKDIKSNQE